jgi:hypothetical protein
MADFFVDEPYGSDTQIIYITYFLLSVFFSPQDNQKVYVFHLVGDSLPFHLKASLLEGHRRGAEILHCVGYSVRIHVTQTFPALISVRNLALTGEGSQECIHLWELLECSICDPRVGVRPGPPAICASFCDMVFKACSESYFSIDTKTQVKTL